MSESTVAERVCLAIGAAAVSLERQGRCVLLAATGCLGLVIGILVYLTDRDASRAALIPTIAALAGHKVFGTLGQWLPGFVHPFAFSLFTAAALPSRPLPRYGACIAWCAVNVAFEAGQHPQVKLRLAKALRDSLGQAPPAQALADYFLRGTFDRGDIVAAALGALAAAAVLRWIQPVSGKNMRHEALGSAR